MATRGKEIQDFIKSQKKTARQMFEEAGYKYTYCENDENDDECIDYYDDKKYQSIVFRLRKKRYAVYGTIGVDMETHKLIVAQCKELGWL